MSTSRSRRSCSDACVSRSTRPTRSASARRRGAPSTCECLRRASGTHCRFVNCRLEVARLEEGRPLAFASSLVLMWVVMPTWQVPSWHLRQMVQPMATIAMVANPTRSEPRHIILTTSRPLFMPPSHHSSTRSRSPLSMSARCVSHSRFHRQADVAQGVRARRPRSALVAGQRNDVGAGPWPLPTAMMPTPGTTGIFTEMRALVLAVFSSSISCARSSME